MAGNIHRSNGYVGNTALSLNLDECRDSVRIATPTGQITPFGKTTPPINPAYYRDKSNGLSGGAISTIVITCAVALIVITIIAMILRGSKAVTPTNSSIVGLKTIDKYQE